MHRPSVIAAHRAASFSAAAISDDPRADAAGAATTAAWGAVIAASNLLDLGSAEDAGRHEDEDDGENREGGDVLVLDREIGRPEGLDEADDQAAEHRAGERADAAEHRGRERLDPRDEAVGEAHHAVIEEVHGAGDGG